MMEMLPAKTYPPVGYCIYCGTSEQELSKEHILPRSLGGNLILPQASCERCACIIGKFEQTCARFMFGPYRIRMQMPTRNPKERPTTLPLKILKRDGSKTTVDLPASVHPSALVMCKFAPPTILTGLESEKRHHLEIHAYANSNILRLYSRLRAKALHLGSFDALAFSRMIAKVAHGAAIAEANMTARSGSARWHHNRR